MSMLVWYTFFAILSYIVVDIYKEKYPKLDVRPSLYFIGAFGFGALWCMLYFAYKVYRHKNYGDFSK